MFLLLNDNYLLYQKLFGNCSLTYWISFVVQCYVVLFFCSLHFEPFQESKTLLEPHVFIMVKNRCTSTSLILEVCPVKNSVTVV